ncbi:EamA family transporter [Parasedimentitalea psychrophila]|uniref:EamA family transporter n=1 Tax=Parasedimentitalea psychrophila TaxID=2997337 RepID=A0A9Y2P3E8_9RHOB|nr:EamA family transporter [Parasedimentitalea psychrophila]WIY25967.1 EamA family transporter [Parasedimentitalea psychrophila]
MSATLFLAVLFAAFLHAGWNALVKTGGDKLQAMFILSTSQGAMGLLMALVLPLPQGQIWLWLLASGLVHSLYKFFLTSAYEHGDLSRVYPIARGLAPMLVALVGVFVLADQLSLLEYLGIAALGTGIIAMARGVFSNGESRHMLRFAFASALMTACYSLIDGLGAREAGDATLFVAWMFLIDGVIFGSWALWHRGTSVLTARRRVWLRGCMAGGASLAAYWIAVWAMTQAPIALVTALRETSILFAVLIGVLVFRERFDRAKAVATLLIVGGVVLTRI